MYWSVYPKWRFAHLVHPSFVREYLIVDSSPSQSCRVYASEDLVYYLQSSSEETSLIVNMTSASSVGSTHTLAVINSIWIAEQCAFTSARNLFNSSVFPNAQYIFPLTPLSFRPKELQHLGLLLLVLLRLLPCVSPSHLHPLHYLHTFIPLHLLPKASNAALISLNTPANRYKTTQSTPSFSHHCPRTPPAKPELEATPYPKHPQLPGHILVFRFRAIYIVKRAYHVFDQQAYSYAIAD